MYSLGPTSGAARQPKRCCPTASRCKASPTGPQPRGGSPPHSRPRCMLPAVCGKQPNTFWVASARPLSGATTGPACILHSGACLLHSRNGNRRPPDPAAGLARQLGRPRPARHRFSLRRLIDTRRPWRGSPPDGFLPVNPLHPMACEITLPLASPNSRAGPRLVHQTPFSRIALNILSPRQKLRNTRCQRELNRRAEMDQLVADFRAIRSPCIGSSTHQLVFARKATLKAAKSVVKAEKAGPTNRIGNGIHELHATSAPRPDVVVGATRPPNAVRRKNKAARPNGGGKNAEAALPNDDVWPREHPARRKRRESIRTNSGFGIINQPCRALPHRNQLEQITTKLLILSNPLRMTNQGTRRTSLRSS